ncbi:hypothetical protein BJ138DRAFT_1119658 [Hygrophoropsis aurantiaca]|uniref:Uncharacterized protein n=1 Tax=Hygrophoropsis aurantiaca TaxID=72124 RepID=A0ACB7ZSY5_9AGAM|nr:hypothetical protein BJ138DRAFT_1119658 [Hygrophoropsis aurantiaca]
MTPAEKAAQTRANRVTDTSLRSEDATEHFANNRPSRKAKDLALQNQVWLADKSLAARSSARKRAASTVPHSEKAKQPRVSNAALENTDSAPENAHHDTRGHPPKSKPAPKKPAANEKTTPHSEVPSGIENPYDDDTAPSSSDGGENADDGAYRESEQSDSDGLEGLAKRPNMLKAQLRSEAYPSDDDDDYDFNSTISESISAENIKKSSSSRYRKTQVNPEASSASQVSAPRAPPKKGKRALGYEREKPEWGDIHQGSQCKKDVKMEEPTTSSGIFTGESDGNWSTSTHLKYSDDGKVNLKIQQPHIQALLHESISALQKYLIFEDAYPLFDERQALMRKLLLNAAHENALWKSQLREVITRIQNDVEYTSALASVSLGRVSQFRGNIEKVASRHIISAYSLTKDSVDDIVTLLQDDNYIFPVNAQGEPITSKPYQHPAILETIGEYFFHTEGCLGVKFKGHFTSTLDGHPEPELPPAMIAMAATAVRAALEDFKANHGRRGRGKRGANFSSSLYSGIYIHHVDIINGLFGQSARGYHKMMSGMYTTVSGVEKATTSTTKSTLLRIRLEE